MCFGSLPLSAAPFPTARVLVLVSSQKQVTAIFENVAWLLAHRIGRVQGGRSDQESCHRQIATVNSCALRETKGWDIVLLADGEQAVRDKVWREIIAASPSRLYGFLSPDGKQLSPRQQLMLDGVLGTVIHQVPGLAGTAATVHVVLSAVPAYSDASVQRHWALNMAAAIAAATCDGDVSQLEQFALPKALVQHAARADGRTVLIVDSSRGGTADNATASRLVFPAAPSAARGQPPAPAAHPRRADATAGGELLPNLDVDVVVQASNGIGHGVLPGFPPRRSGETR